MTSERLEKARAEYVESCAYEMYLDDESRLAKNNEERLLMREAIQREKLKQRILNVEIRELEGEAL